MRMVCNQILFRIKAWILKMRYGKRVLLNGKIELLGRTAFAISPDAQLRVQAPLSLNAGQIPGSRRDTMIRLDHGAVMENTGRFQLFYDADVVVFNGGALKLGSGFINSGCQIRCAKRIEIGEDVAISRDVSIMDSDFHVIEKEGYVKTAPVTIGNHVWIGNRVTILKGVTIGDGSIIAAGALVTKDIPDHCLAAGQPARVVRENVSWRLH